MLQHFPETNSANDYHESCDKPESSSHNQLTIMQYETLGETLLICEAACHRVGVPWLPPTKVVQRRNEQFEAPLEDFVRYSLVTVSTKTLETYCDELETAALNANEARQLSIPHPSVLERYAMSALVFGILCAADFLFCRFLGVPTTIAVVSSAIIGILGGATCAALSSEQHRRTTFHWVLLKELLRRSGQDENNSSTVPILPVQPKPLSER